jgi:hypothetical protein
LSNKKIKQRDIHDGYTLKVQVDGICCPNKRHECLPELEGNLADRQAQAPIPGPKVAFMRTVKYVTSVMLELARKVSKFNHTMAAK